MAPIPGAGPSSPEYKKINPLGKIPTLDADGTIIAESEVINEYIEDKYTALPRYHCAPQPQNPRRQGRYRETHGVAKPSRSARVKARLRRLCRGPRVHTRRLCARPD